MDVDQKTIEYGRPTTPPFQVINPVSRTIFIDPEIVREAS
jgi:hypothetical protein